MMTAFAKTNRKEPGLTGKRLVALLLALIQCASLTLVGAPAAYAEELPDDTPVIEVLDPLPDEPGEDDGEEPAADEEELPDRAQILTAGFDSMEISVLCPAGSDVPADAVLRVEAPDGAEAYQDRMTQALGLTEDDLLFGVQFLKLSVETPDGAALIPACPVEVCIRLFDEGGSRAETWAAVGFDETGAFGTQEGTTVLAEASEAENPGCTLRFTASDLTLFGLCSSARRLATLHSRALHTAVYGPRNASLGHEALHELADAGVLLLDGFSLRASSPAPDGLTALWVDVGMHAPELAYQNLALYTLDGMALAACLSDTGSTGGPVYLGDASGLALVTPIRETELYASDAVTLSGEVPDGVTVHAQDVSASFADFDVASLNAGGPDPLEMLHSVSLFPGWQKAIEMMQSAAQAQAVPEARPWYELIGAYDISMRLHDEEYQPDGEHPIQVSIRNPAIAEAEDLQLWHLHDDGSYEQMDFAFADDTVMFNADSFSVYLLYSVTLEKTLTTEDGLRYRVSVRYDSSSGIPKNAELSVTELRPGDPGYDEYVARTAELLGKDPEALTLARPFDITLFDPATGAHYQPDNGVQVAISLLDEDLNEYEQIRVVHLFGDGEELAETMDVSVGESAVTFRTGGFSVYVLTGTLYRRTYTFYVWKDGVWSAVPFTTDDGEEVFTQTVKNGERPVIPSPGASETEGEFAGWYAKKNNSDEYEDDPFDFDSRIDEDESVSLYAVFRDYVYVIFHDQYSSETDSFPIASKRRAELVQGESTTAQVRISDVDVTYSDGSASGGDEVNYPDMAFYAWSRTPISTPGSDKDDNGDSVVPIVPDENGCITISQTTDLYPIFRSVKWLSLWSGPAGSGASYFPARYYFDGHGPKELQVPAWEGHAFQGWYAGTVESDGSVTYGQHPIAKVNDGGPSDVAGLIDGARDGGVEVIPDTEGGYYLRIESNATLYAKWTDAQTLVDYKIIVWKQKTTDALGLPDAEKSYDFYECAVESVPVGSTATIADEYKRYNTTKPDFAGCSVRFDADTPVNAKGYTVLNVWYDRTADYEPTGIGHDLIFADSSGGDVYFSYTDVAYGTSLTAGNEGGSFVPADPEKKCFTFTGWFADSTCSTQVFFTEEELAAYDGYNKTVLYDTMPDRGLTIYAGWEHEWYLVQIDPNYGSFNGTGGTWFWESYDGELVSEYTQVTRDYVESSSGEYFYVKKDRAYYGYSGVEWDNSEPDRDAYYTTDPGKATETATFEYAPGVYSYAGWFEVHDDGTETPYDFSRHVDHHLKLKLHWKKLGDYYLRYLDTKATEGDSDDELYSDPTIYADNAAIVLTRSVPSPEGWTFIGWRVQGEESGRIYALGETFTLRSDYAATVSGKDTVTLESVFVKLDTATLVYDFNGGVFVPDEEHPSFDFGHSDVDDPHTAAEMDAENKWAKVYNIDNNSDYILSGSDESTVKLQGAVFKGWCDRPVYDPNDAEAHPLLAPGQRVGIDTAGSTTLYAVWEIEVHYRLNVPEGGSADWGGDWTQSGYERTAPDTYTLKLFRGNPVAEPSYIPQYTGSDGLMFRFWVNTADGRTAEEQYDFSAPVDEERDIFAYWGGPVKIPLHALDASEEEIVETAETTAWLADGGNTTLPVALEPITLDAAAAYACMKPDFQARVDNGEYAYAFAVAHKIADPVSAVTESERIETVYYNSEQKHIYAVFADGRDDALTEGEDQIYFVWYEQKTLPIAYRIMPASGELLTVDVSSAAPTTTGDALLGSFAVHSVLTQPLGWVGDSTLPYYTYAIGDGAATNASGLGLITTASSSDNNRPTLTVENTWRGFRYTEDGTNWFSCGYDPTLFVVYYALQPTIVMFHEQTVGLDDVLDQSFLFDLKVTQSTTNAQKQVEVEGVWTDEGEPTTYTQDVFDTTQDPNQPYELKNGLANSAILFYSTPAAGEQLGEVFTEGGQTCRYIATAGSVSSQSGVITQRPESNFDTAINGVLQQSEPYSYSCSSDGTGGTVSVTFTNTHKAAQVEVHIARIESGRILLRDDLRSASNPDSYRFTLSIGESKTLNDEVIPASDLYTDATGAYAFAAIAYGTVGTGELVELKQLGVTSVAYAARTEGGPYALLLKDSDGEVLDTLNGCKLFYLYYPMPKLQYVRREGQDLSLIRGSQGGAPSNKITYGEQEIHINGQLVEQNQRILLPLGSLRISQASQVDNFRMPPILDDETYLRYLAYDAIDVGPALSYDGAAGSIDELAGQGAAGQEMQLEIRDNKLQWSFDGDHWQEFAEDQTVFAIYTERGYDLQISKHVNTTASGENPIFTDRTFKVTLTRVPALKPGEVHTVEYASVSQIAVDENGRIEVELRDGGKIKILGLGRGDFTVTESNNENYDLSAKSGPIIGSATTPATVENSSFTVELDTEKQLVLTNTPRAICEVTQGDQEDGSVFYTLTDAIDYVVNNIPSVTANIEMLSDYLMPAADTLEIPSNADITLRTAATGENRYQPSGQGATRAAITRSAALTASALITNHGVLTLDNITLDGDGIVSSAPILISEGGSSRLTVDYGTTLTGGVNLGGANPDGYKGLGGAIYADGTVVFTRGLSTNLNNNRADKGGLLYYAGVRTVTFDMPDLTSMTGNSADYGGAVYAAGGTITVADGALSGTASQDGGAIYAENAVVELGAAVSGNAANGRGGAVYASQGAVTVTQGAAISGRAAQDGGAIYAGTASVAVEGGTLGGTAGYGSGKGGRGGVIWSGSGTVTVSGGSLTGGVANGTGETQGLGGAIFTNSAAVVISGGSLSGNRAQRGGGAVYSVSGAVSVSGDETELANNTAATGSGGAIHVGSGNVTLSGGSLFGNKATGGNGGAIYAETGNVTVSGNATKLGDSSDSSKANRAKNGAAVYVDGGNGSFSGGSITGNLATEGGAVGFGGENVRLDFSGKIVIRNNTCGDAASNVYLDQDTDGVINTSGIDSDAYVGIYVPDTILVPGETPETPITKALFEKRGDVGCEFGIYSGSGTMPSVFRNDREANLKSVVNTTTMRIYWSSTIKVEVRYLASFSSSLPNGTNGAQKLAPTNYNPMSGGVSPSVLAEELRPKCSNLATTAVYATALVEGDYNYDHYLTQLLWEEGKWQIKKRDGSQVDLNGKKIVIYFADPAFLSIENNSAFDFDMTDFTVKLANKNRSLLNNADLAGPTGVGLVFARDGSIQDELKPAEMTDGKLTLAKNGGSIILLIPGGQGATFALKDGVFVDGSDTVKLRVNGTPQGSLNAANPINLSGTTFSNTDTYEIVFGEDKAICKISCPEQTSAVPSEYVEKYVPEPETPGAEVTAEYTFARMRDAVNFAKNHGLTSFTIEMLVDYLMPGTDAVMVANNSKYATDYAAAASHAGHPAFIVFTGLEEINFTTALNGHFRYPGTDPDRRATISRGNGNTKVPLLFLAGPNNAINIISELKQLDFDGKNLTGACDGGALKACDVKVTVTDCDFKNFIALNGGAVFVSYGEELSRNSTRNEYNFSKFPGGKQYPEPLDFDDEHDTIYKVFAVLTVTNAKFRDCESRATMERSGGGAIWTNARTLDMTGCSFDNCKAVQGNANNQGGALFHRIDTKTQRNYAWQPYAAYAVTNMENCSFSGCRANAGGGMESDALHLLLDNCSFVQCTTSSKDGGAINMYIFEENYNYTSLPSEMRLTDCTFLSCTANRNGGSVRSLAVNTYIDGCQFSNSAALGGGNASYWTGGGAVCCSNQKATYLEIKDSTFNGSTMNNLPGGAIITFTKNLRIEDTSFSDCKILGTAAKNGGCVQHYVYDSNKANSTVEVIGSSFVNCTSTQNGGGICSNAILASFAGSTFQDCYTGSAGKGGGVSLDSANTTNTSVLGCTFKSCTAAAEGGGLYSVAVKTLTIGSYTEDGVTRNTLFEECTSSTNGGGVYHRKENSTVSVADTTFNGCTAGSHGGGFYTDYLKDLRFTNCVVKGNTASGSGGGIYNSTSSEFVLRDTTVSGNKAGATGGGVYTKKNLWLICTIIERNQLTTNTVADAAGAYILSNDGQLLIGEPGSEIDNSAVMNNTTRNGADSNLRLPVITSGDHKDENQKCVSVYCDLGKKNGVGGYIGVVNAWKEGTQFGINQSNVDNPVEHDQANPDGITVLDAVFNADTNTLYGIIARDDPTFTKIIWAGPPICKITDPGGRLLYFKNNGTDPAIFDILEDGSANARTSAFSLLRGNPVLYYLPDEEGGTGEAYNGTSFVIKMLVENYELTNQITMWDNTERTITLTTAGKRDTDGYPYDNSASGDRATITRGPGVTGSMVSATSNMEFRKIVLDGGGVSSSQNGGILSVHPSYPGVGVVLQSDAIFQYGKASNGGGVSVTSGTFTLNNGLIRFCEATNDGGAVYIGSTGTFHLTQGNLQQCQATNGGGACLADGAFNMSGGFISGCVASDSGGGVYVAAEKTLNMSGGSGGVNITANSAGVHGGGIAAGTDAILNFSKQVNVSKNTRGAEINNVELDQDSNAVINYLGLQSRSYIGVYVPGSMEPDTTPLYEGHGREGDPFGSFPTDKDTLSTAQLYCFVNDRNGLKGGLIANPAPGTIYWIKIFSIELSKQVYYSENIPQSYKDRIDNPDATDAPTFQFRVRLWNTEDNTSGITPAMIAADIQAAIAAEEDSKYGEIPFEGEGTMVTAYVTLKNGEKLTAENLPDGLGYDVLEWPTESPRTPGYSNVNFREDGTLDLSKPINYRSGKTGENKTRTDINPYVSVVEYDNMLAVCKITDANGNLLYRNDVSVGKDYQMPAVYMDLNETFDAINSSTVSLYPLNSSTSYSGALRVQLLLPEYTLKEGLTLTDTRPVTFTTASVAATDDFPFLGASTATGSVKRASSFNTDAMLTQGAGTDLTLTAVKLDGARVETSKSSTDENFKTAGLVFVPSGATLTVTGGAVLQNARTTFHGAGVYVESGAKLNLSGNPVFGGTDTDSYGDMLFNESGNFVVTPGKSVLDELQTAQGWKTNGGKRYTVAHEDIYLEEAHENDPRSIEITGALSGANGSIWLWAENDYHRKQLMPFAILPEARDGGNLHIFRNAQPDDVTENNTDSYLYGVRGEEELKDFVCWNGIKGSARVMLVKVLENNAGYTPLPEKTFTVYTDPGATTVAKGTVAGVAEPVLLQNLKSGAGGAFFIGELAYRTYYIKETGTTGVFVITVDQGGVVTIEGTGANRTLTPVKTVELTAG